MSDGNRNNEKRKIRALKHEKKKQLLKDLAALRTLVACLVKRFSSVTNTFYTHSSRFSYPLEFRGIEKSWKRIFAKCAY